MGLLQLSNHTVQNRQTGEQMPHWDMLNKENSNLVDCLTCPSTSFALQFGDFVPRDCSAAKGLFREQTTKRKSGFFSKFAMNFGWIAEKREDIPLRVVGDGNGRVLTPEMKIGCEKY